MVVLNTSVSERTAASRIGGVEAKGSCRRDIEKRCSKLDVLGNALVHEEVHMSLTAVDERLPGGVDARHAFQLTLANRRSLYPT